MYGPMRLLRVLAPSAALCGLLASCVGAPVRAPAADAPPQAVVLSGPHGTPAAAVAIWSSRDLPPRVLRAANELPVRLAVGTARSGTVDLRDVVGATRPLPPRRDGAMVPVTVTAVDPEPLRYSWRHAFLGQVLTDGLAAITQTAAGVRGLGEGDGVRVRRNGHPLDVEVGAIVPEDDIFDRELVVPIEAARALRLPKTYAVIVAVPEEAADWAAQKLADAAGRFPVRVVRLDRAEARAPNVLAPARVKYTFGEYSFRVGRNGRIIPDPAWVAANIATWRLPVIGWVTCHRLILPQLWYAMDEIRARHLGHLIDSYDGCYVPRTQRGNPEYLSAHAFGIAIDLNAATNGMGRRPTIDLRIVEVMERWGFYWGGRFMVPDGMHFEFTQFVKPSR